MLNRFKKFADYINAKRRPREFDFIGLVTDESRKDTVNTVLEVGSNIRPILDKGRDFELHGLDPDRTISTKAAQEVFDAFFCDTIEHFSTETKYDLIVINMVLEHLEDNAVVFKKLKSLLSDKGAILLHIPNNMHPFALVNRILSHNLKLKVLRVFRPWAEVGTITGWRSYYDHCTVPGMKRLAKKNGLKVAHTYTDYNASDYFAFFPPLFLLVVLFEESVRFCRINLFCAYIAMEVRNEAS